MSSGDRVLIDTVCTHRLAMSADLHLGIQKKYELAPLTGCSVVIDSASIGGNSAQDAARIAAELGTVR